MLELIELIHNGLQLSDPRSWILLACVGAACVAGWYSGDVVAWYTGQVKDAE